MRRLVGLALIGSLALSVAARAADTLVDAARLGDHAGALALIADGADVNATQSNATTPLHWAAYHGDAELVAALLEHGAQADATNEYGSTPLGEAVNIANAEIVEMLLEAGADPDSPNADGQTALMLAARTGVVEIAELLVDYGADVNAHETWRGQTALMWAAGENQPEVAEFLVAHGADVNVRATTNDWGRQVTNEPRAQYRPTGGLTPLLYAARAGCVRCLAAMLDAGADINRPSPEGVTPLMVATDNYRYDAAKYLLERGADPQLMDWWGRTALYIAVDVNTYFGGGGFGAVPPPLEIPDEASALDIARMLLDAGVDPNIQLTLHRPDRAGAGRFVDDTLRTGATPLTRAAVSHDVDAIRLLLEYGADVDMPNVMGVTPLMIAAGMGVTSRDMRGEYGHVSNTARLEPDALAALEVLIDAGADVNARVTDTKSWTARIARLNSMTDRDGQTAIYAAAGWGWTDVVRLLLENGARTDIVDANGKSPLDAARGDAGGRPEGVNEETAALIEEWRANL